MRITFILLLLFLTITTSFPQAKDTTQTPHTAKEFLWQGVAKLLSGNFQGAIQDCNKAIELDSNESYAYKIRGAAKSGLEDYSGALGDYNKAVSLNPDSANTYMYRGSVKIELNDKVGGMQDFNKAIMLNPNLPDYN